MTAKKLSIVIPVYNNPEELRLTLGSIARQDFPLEDLEVLVCDDGSHLDMKAVGKEFSGSFSVRYFWQEDQGFRPGTARNMGIRAAQGALCVFLDCGVIVTAEEHQMAGGLGGAVSEYLALNCPAPVEMVGVNDRFGQSGQPDELMSAYGLTSKEIAEAARKVITRK